jgi:hypothetical protein
MPLWVWMIVVSAAAPVLIVVVAEAIGKRREASAEPQASRG